MTLSSCTTAPTCERSEDMSPGEEQKIRIVLDTVSVRCALRQLSPFPWPRSREGVTGSAREQRLLGALRRKCCSAGAPFHASSRGRGGRVAHANQLLHR